ncbi:hypothetical protein [Desulfosporosinus sp. I2]|uniref:hypothetical protein n=1 Tax=Desulfosporosinus sp. I2 TaxID=1617025 RepID=UPI0012E08834|nr:hypothetical protein [Desulfosporosinus sp. I2]
MSHGRRETSLFPALLYESGLEPSLATTRAKAFTPCDRDPLGLGRRRGGSRHTCSAMRSSCQTRALSRYGSGMVPGQSDIRRPRMAKCPCSPKTLPSHVLAFLQDGEKGPCRTLCLPGSKELVDAKYIVL